MSCEEIENRILDYQENQLPPDQRQEVETHLAGCASCRQFSRQLQQLDLALSSGIKMPELSAGFDRRLQQRIQTSLSALSEAQRAERKRQLQAEFEAGLAQIRRGSFTIGNLLSCLTWPALASAAGWFAWRLTPAFTAHLTAHNLGGLDPAVLPWLMASAVILAICLPGAFHQNKSAS